MKNKGSVVRRKALAKHISATAINLNRSRLDEYEDQRIREGLAKELHTAARKRYVRRRVTLKGINDLLQADLIDVRKYARENKGFTFILVVINAFTKFAYAEGIKRKNGNTMKAAFEKIFHQMSVIPKYLQTDMGTEFYNPPCQQLFRELGIHHYSTYTTVKASIVERFIRTIKSELWKRFTVQGSFRWTDILQSCVEEYNHRKHSSTGFAPVDVNENNESAVLSRLQRGRPSRVAYSAGKLLEPGQLVRISKNKGQFQKGYTPNWSSELFRITNIQPTTPLTYLLETVNKKPIAGGFYREELLPTRYPEVTVIEKILKRSTTGSKYLVRLPDFGKSIWVEPEHL